MENPMTDKDYRDINAKLARVLRVREALARAERAHIDISDMQTRLDIHEADLKAIKAEFWPDRP